MKQKYFILFLLAIVLNYVVLYTESGWEWWFWLSSMLLFFIVFYRDAINEFFNKPKKVTEEEKQEEDLGFTFKKDEKKKED